VSNEQDKNDVGSSAEQGSPDSYQYYELWNKSDDEGSESRVDSQRSRVAVLVEITATVNRGAGIRADEAVTIIAEQLQASAEAVVASFNRSQSFAPHGVQVSVSSTRARGSVDDGDDVCIDITDEGRAALERARVLR
jgi:hypothetical protein